VREKMGEKDLSNMHGLRDPESGGGGKGTVFLKKMFRL
jgi:hypothetical protein